MLVCIDTKEVSRRFTVEVSTLQQVYSFLKTNLTSKEYKYILDEELLYLLLARDSSIRPIALFPDTSFISPETYDTIYIGEKIAGSDPFTIGAGITAAVTASTAAAVTAAAATSFALTATVYAVGTVALLGISFALGAILQALSPSLSMKGDAATVQKVSIWNGIQNIKEQGGGVPLAIGETLIGGVIISTSVTVAKANLSSELIPESNPFASLNPNTWYRTK